MFVKTSGLSSSHENGVDVEFLQLPLLNEATQAWAEQEYYRTVHGELGRTPIERALARPSVVRPSPSTDELRRASPLALHLRMRLRFSTAHRARSLRR